MKLSSSLTQRSAPVVPDTQAGTRQDDTAKEKGDGERGDDKEGGNCGKPWEKAREEHELCASVSGLRTRQVRQLVVCDTDTNALRWCGFLVC